MSFGHVFLKVSSPVFVVAVTHRRLNSCKLQVLYIRIWFYYQNRPLCQRPFAAVYLRNYIIKRIWFSYQNRPLCQRPFAAVYLCNYIIKRIWFSYQNRPLCQRPFAAVHLPHYKPKSSQPSITICGLWFECTANLWFFLVSFATPQEVLRVNSSSYLLRWEMASRKSSWTWRSRCGECYSRW